MAKRKKPSQPSGPSFHRDFQPPTDNQRSQALGSFPGAVHAASSREAMLLLSGCSDSDNTSRSITIMTEAGDLDNPLLYKPTGRSVTSRAVPKPRDELDWLANVPEEGQTFDEYIQFLTLRSGRIRPIANANGVEIELLPIVASSSSSSTAHNGNWEEGPPLEPLVTLTRAFFDRPVRLLAPAILTKVDKTPQQKRKKKTMDQRCAFEIQMPTDTNGTREKYTIVGRTHVPSGSCQYKVDSLLNALAGYRERRSSSGCCTVADSPSSGENFCIMALTMQDLYDGPTDLFVSGMAAGGSKVAVFSFSRYHPHIKMHPGRWFDYGYGAAADTYSYYEEEEGTGKKNKKRGKKSAPLSNEPTTFQSMTPKSRSEFWRRSGKLLIHELGHLYGLDHCIFNCCLMNGTGHLVEDFAAPFHFCPVCLRKLQWRLGFGVTRRYEALADAFETMGLATEASWARKQVVALERQI